MTIEPRAWAAAAALLLCCCAAGAREKDGEFTRLTPDVTPNFQPASKDTEGGLWMIMEQAEEELKRSPVRVRDPLLDLYMKDLICRLTQDFCSDVRVYVLRVPHFNASMAPNGMMQVWTGLLLRARNEAQLAAVLGHELGHYLKRHSLDRFESAKSLSNVLTFLSIGLSTAVAAGGVTYNTAQGVSLASQLALVGGYFAFNRSQESEADRFGVQLMADARMDPAESSTVWKNLIDEENAAKERKDRPSLFFSTHPQAEKRMEILGGYAQQLRARAIPVDTATPDGYREHVAPHLAMLLADELNLHQFGRSEFLFRSLLESGVAPGILNFYLGELYRIRKDEGDTELAVLHYEAALRFPDGPADAYRSLGLLYLKSNRAEQARTQFTMYLNATPAAQDREMIEYYMKMEGAKQ